MSVAAELLALCQAKGLTIATAESCTGGMVSVALTDLAGSSKVFLWGAVTYANSAKRSQLGVGQMTLVSHGAVSEAVAGEMAEGARARSGADLAVAITGVAGPGGTAAKPEGRVCFAVATAAETTSLTVDFGALGRAEVRLAARDRALALLLDAAQADDAP